MEPKEFIEAVRQRVIENNILEYQNLLESTIEAKDPYWAEILPIYNNFTQEQKISFVKFLRLIEVNTLSHILGILDGSTFLNEKRESFKLVVESNGEIINGELQDIFLELEEDSE